MSTTTLQPGDRCHLEKKGKDGKIRKLRYIVVESLGLKAKGDDAVPVTRAINRKNSCNIDRPDNRVKEPRVRWISRAKLRKLPDK